MTSMDHIRKQKLTQSAERIKDFTHKYSKEFNEISSELKQKILNSKAHELRRDICDNKLYSSKAAVLVYCFASIEANKKTNCLTEIMFQEAIDNAVRLDEHLKQSNSPIGPLHGIPFSIKDTFDIKGFGNVELEKKNSNYFFTDSTVGLIKYCFSEKDYSSILVNEIIRLGGIPFVKTNVPQTLMSFECSNPLWGTTSNPFDKSLSPGGSSGGEAALISARGSIIGLGR